MGKMKTKRELLYYYDYYLGLLNEEHRDIHNIRFLKGFIHGIGKALGKEYDDIASDIDRKLEEMP